MAKQLTYFVVDDNVEAIDLLVAYGQRMPQLKLAGTETSSIRALRMLNDHPVDLLLADVDMPGMTGIVLVQALHPAPLVILVTGHARFAVQGFELHAVDFLVKPPAFDRFAGAIHRAGRLHGLPALPPGEQEPAPDRDYTFVLCQGESFYQRVDFDQISYVEASGNHIRIVLYDQQNLECRMTLAAFTARLPQADFMQVHRSFVINLRLIRALDGPRKILMVGTRRGIPVGEHFQTHFQRVWKQLTG